MSFLDIFHSDPFYQFSRRATLLNALLTQIEREVRGNHYQEAKEHFREIMAAISTNTYTASLTRLIGKEVEVMESRIPECPQKAEMIQLNAEIKQELMAIISLLQETVSLCEKGASQELNKNEQNEIIGRIQALTRLMKKIEARANLERKLFKRAPDKETYIHNLVREKMNLAYFTGESIRLMDQFQEAGFSIYNNNIKLHARTYFLKLLDNKFEVINSPAPHGINSWSVEIITLHALTAYMGIIENNNFLWAGGEDKEAATQLIRNVKMITFTDKRIARFILTCLLGKKNIDPFISDILRKELDYLNTTIKPQAIQIAEEHFL
jgi:hypothetical protein